MKRQDETTHSIRPESAYLHLGALNKAIFTAENSFLLALNIEDGGSHGLHDIVSFHGKLALFALRPYSSTFFSVCH